MTLDENIMIVQAELNRQTASVKRVERKTDLSEGEKIRIGQHYKFYRSVQELLETVKRDKAAVFGRMPPHAPELEVVVLGGCILESALAVRNGKEYPPPLARVRQYFKPEHFYQDAHQLIYTALLELPEGKGDLIGLHEKLRQKGQIEVVGGPAYLAELTNKVSNTSNIEYNSRILIDFALKRRLIMLGSEVVNRGLSDTEDPHEIFDYLKEEAITLDQWTKK